MRFFLFYFPARRIKSVYATKHWLFVWTSNQLEVWTYPHWFAEHRHSTTSSSSTAHSTTHSTAARGSETGSASNRLHEIEQLLSWRATDFLLGEWKRHPGFCSPPMADSGTTITSTPPLRCFCHPVYEVQVGDKTTTGNHPIQVP